MSFVSRDTDNDYSDLEDALDLLRELQARKNVIWFFQHAADSKHISECKDKFNDALKLFSVRRAFQVFRAGCLD